MATKYIDLKDGRQAEILSPLGVWTMIKIKSHRDYIIVYHLKNRFGVWSWTSDMGYGNDVVGIKKAYELLKK